MQEEMSREELIDLPPLISVERACRVLGLSRGFGYNLLREGKFPVPAHRVGRLYKVPTAPLLRYLGVERDHNPHTPPATTDEEATFSPAIRRPLDFREPVYVKTKSGKRIRVNPKKTYTIKGRRVLGADYIAERQA